MSNILVCPKFKKLDVPANVLWDLKHINKDKLMVDQTFKYSTKP